MVSSLKSCAVSPGASDAMRGGARAGRGRRDALCASAVPRPARASALAAAAAIAAVVLALVPLSVGVSPAALPYVQMSEAKALTAYNANAYAFLQKCAEAAGLSINDYMLTCGIVIAGSTGLNIIDGDVSYGADQATQGLTKLVSTAEWPSWDDLTDEQQQSYGTSDVYTAHQFNALAGCFGLSDSRDVYYSSGGGDIDGDASTIASRIGELGEKWSTGAILQASDVYSVLTNPNNLVNKSGYNNFGLRLTKTVTVDSASYRFMRANPGLSGYMGSYPINGQSWFNYKTDVKIDSSTYQWVFVGVWTSPLRQIEITSGYGLRNYDNKNSSNQWQGLTVAGKMEDHASSGNTYRGQYDPEKDWLNEDWGGGWVVNGTDLDTDEFNYEQQLPDTPTGLYGKDGIDDSKEPEGIGTKRLYPGITYPDITGTPRDGDDPPYVPPTPSERPENPYNPPDAEKPQYQSGTPEWKQETTENVTPLININFDKLFPFSMLYDVPMLFDKVQSVTGSDISGGVYNSVSIPVPIGRESEDMRLDLTLVHDFLGMTKPFFQILLVALLLFALIEFWRGILTGD